MKNGSFWDENEHAPWSLKWVVKEAILCLAERRLPKSLLVRKKVSPFWYAGLQWHLRQTGKIKVGFGPVIEGEYNIGVRGSRIDPIVNQLNAPHSPYAAGIFFEFEDMRSEEHTSELQSHLKLVCRLLLEKKKMATRTTG